MQVLYPCCCGVDIHKKFVVACLLITGEDGSGFVEYQRHTRKGLLNQCWKDFHDSISFADGTLAKGPIAMAEVQGYVYEAKRKMAEI